MRYVTRRSRRRAISFVVVRQVGIERLFIARPPFTPPPPAPCSSSALPRVTRARVQKSASLRSFPVIPIPPRVPPMGDCLHRELSPRFVRFAWIARRNPRRASSEKRRRRRVAESIYRLQKAHRMRRNGTFHIPPPSSRFPARLASLIYGNKTRGARAAIAIRFG